MRLIKEVLAAVFGAARHGLERDPAKSAEEAAWSDYHSSWEMDPPPEPREVFLAGYRAGQEQQQR